MDRLVYLDFDLDIERSDQGYRVEVNSPAGQTAEVFQLPFSDLEIENALLRFGRPQRGTRSMESSEAEAARVFGARLFGAVFGGEVRGCLRSSIEEAQRQNSGLRIRLRLTDTPELTDLPWEFLYNPALKRFLALSAQTPLVRFLELPERVRPLSIVPPLRILVVIASPRGYPPLDVEREWRNLSAALAGLQQHQMVTVERLSSPQLSMLQRQLRRDTYHVLHFIGHGAFDEQAQDGVLLMEDAEGYGVRVSSRDLGVILHDHGSLRLAVLNACEGGRSSRSDPFAGAAQSLVQQGIPAVIAMQFPVTDEAAITFSQGFYGALADGYPVDASIAEARKEILAGGNGVEWGTPVLYMRAPDGQIFDVAAPPAAGPQRGRGAELLAQAEAAIAVGHWAVAGERLRTLLEEAPNHAAAQHMLQHAQTQQNLAIWYNQGRKHVAAGRWPEALEAFGRVHTVDARYRDVAVLLGAISREIAMSGAAAPTQPTVEPAVLAPAASPEEAPGVEMSAQTSARTVPRRHWLGIAAGLALTIVLGLGVLLTRRYPAETALPTAAPARAAVPTSAPTSPPTPDATTRVAPVAAGKYMVLLGQLEPLGATRLDPSKTQFLFESLQRTYETNYPTAKLQIRTTPAILRSPEDARAAADVNQAIVVVWGNYSDDQTQVHVDLGTLKPFPTIPFGRELLERTINLTVKLDNPRQQSVAPQVLAAYQWIVSAAGDNFAIARNAELLDLMRVDSPPPDENTIAAQAYHSLRLYYTDTPHALELLTAALDQDPVNPLLLGLRSLALVREGKFADALQDSTSAAALDPTGKWPGASIVQGFTAILGGNYNQAGASFSTADAKQPNSWFTLFLRGFASYMKRDYVGARSDLERSLQLGPEASYPYLTLIMLDLREGRAADAKALLAIVQQRFPDPNIGVRQARAFFAQQGSQSLFSVLLTAAGNLSMNRYPDVVRSSEAGLALVEQISQTSQANPDPTAARSLQAIVADLSFERGFAQCNLKQYAEAEKSYGEAIAADSDFVLVALLRAEARLKQQNAAGAAEDLAAVQQSRLGPAFAPFLAAAQSGQFGCESMLRP